MKYSKLVDSGATITELQEFLTEGETVPVAVRMPENLRDSAKEIAALSGMTFTSFVKQAMIEKLSKKE